MSAAGKWPGQLPLHAPATLALVERLGRGVLLKYPQVKSARRPAPGDRPRCLGQEPGTDTQPLEVVPHMKVVQVGAPDRVSVEDRMSEARDAAVEVGDEGVPVWRGPREPAGPLGHPVSDDVAVKIRIQVRAPVVPPPAVSVQACDRRGIACCRLAVLHIPMLPEIASEHDRSRIKETRPRCTIPTRCASPPARDDNSSIKIVVGSSAVPAASGENPATS
jgi:hypothetical protein